MCLHHSFQVKANVFRLNDIKDGDNKDAIPKGFSVDISVWCTECGQPFAWVGVPMGISLIQPMVSADGLELRAPLIPCDTKPEPNKYAS